MITYHTNSKIPEAVLAEAQKRANSSQATQYLVYERARNDEQISIVTTCPAVGLIAEVTSSEGTEVFKRVLQIWQTAGAEYRTPKTREPNKFFPSRSGEIELELDDAFPALLRTTEGQYSFGGYTTLEGSTAQLRTFMDLLRSEFDVVELVPQKPFEKSHGSNTGPIVALKAKALPERNEGK